MDDAQANQEQVAPVTLTYGQKLVGIKFNPSGNVEVDKIKNLYANIIDLVRNRATATDSVHATLVNRATNDALEAQMMAVKAITWVE